MAAARLKKLRDIATSTLDKCRYAMKPDENGRSYAVHVPSGDMKYGSFWIRDGAMMAECGLIDAHELSCWIDIVCRFGQNGPEARQLKNGLRVPPWCVADHVNFDGGAVFYPGTYSSSDDQGNGRFGVLPPFCDQYYFVNMLYLYGRQTTREEGNRVLRAEVDGSSPLARAESAFYAGNIDAVTGLCMAGDEHTVDWGFCDSIRKRGHFLFPSVLRYAAGMRLCEICVRFGLPDKASLFAGEAALIKESINRIFARSDGWLNSATGTCVQPDVWGTAFAVYSGALNDDAQRSALQALSGAYAAGTISANGYFRHLPEDFDHSGDTAWEGGDPGTKGLYQNGGYWATPTGWIAYALSLKDRALADRVYDEFLSHTQKHQTEGAPYEWKSPDDGRVSGKYYGTSGALPYEAALRIYGGERGERQGRM